MPDKPRSYKAAGVDVDAGYAVVEKIKKHAASTHVPGALGNLGSFACFFQPDLKNFKEPVLVASNDGVGTKVKLAVALDKHDTVGIDLVAMSVNDLICSGAVPLFFLDYIAVHKVKPEQVEQIVAGIAEGCRQSGCALIGGETAEMNDLYQPGDYDLAGFAVGIVDKANILNVERVKVGDVVIGLPSSGLHSNGYSLARKVLGEADYAEMLTPTKIYVQEILGYLKSGVEIHSIANITGGSFYEKLARAIPTKVNAVLDPQGWQPPPLFKKIQEVGQIEPKEMYSAFNMGIGMCLIVPPSEASKIQGRVIGKITEGNKTVLIEGIG
ncbi:phosphoribosylformylglycinamidine cyclo-ligase [Candidatus Termititenax persephonae]|uniref:Phosphoribosylformylglycinamidine cyclo-ligase n=1 Tax=Candidatus Termititenax persephonae TaxID=2218525 RepID=A0A388THS2_9BACT|nr:phosphoribosylformylglycinamidine cyclo-ligase [Candidatus Termititenax persephonae]